VARSASVAANNVPRGTRRVIVFLPSAEVRSLPASLLASLRHFDPCLQSGRARSGPPTRGSLPTAIDPRADKRGHIATLSFHRCQSRASCARHCRVRSDRGAARRVP
jgi:hypothetical protein